MGEKVKILSKRLQMLARMVTPGSRVADVGCDHGFLSIYLVQAGISPGVIAMDVRNGPLAAARQHIEDCGLGAYIETRISDGLTALAAGEADTVVCAGMGGRLMKRILTEGSQKTAVLKELILQPQSELSEFRRFLREAGFSITLDDMVFDGGKYYSAMRAVPGKPVEESKEPQTTAAVFSPEPAQQRLFDKFGESLLRRRHPILEQYLRRQERAAYALMEQLAGQGTGKAATRKNQLQEELQDIQSALAYFTG